MVGLRLAAVIGALLLPIGPARANVAVRVAGDEETCPRPGEVAALLARIAPELELTDEARPDARFVLVSDFGARYRVSVDGVGREFSDPSRICPERVRAAAVFVSLMLTPHAPAAQETDQETPRPRPSAGPAGAPRPLLQVDLEVDLLLDGTSGRGFASGASARLYVGGEHFGGTLGLTAASSGSRIPLSGSDRALRFPADVGVRFAGRVGRGQLGGDLGVSMFVYHVWKKDVFGVPASDAAIDFAVRAALTMRVWLHRRIGFHAGAQAFMIPNPMRIARPRGSSRPRSSCCLLGRFRRPVRWRACGVVPARC
jgi:hypothetical protein